jgi:hypothetical protein
MSPLPPPPRISRARPRQGRSSSGLTTLQGLDLDSACAPAVTWQLEEADSQDQLQSQCPRFQGNRVLEQADQKAEADMALGDGIRRNIAQISQGEQDRFKAAVLKLDRERFFPDGVGSW